MSQRRIASLYGCHRITVARKLVFLGAQAARQNDLDRRKLAPVTEMQFDDLETFEHCKLKPISVTLAVQKHNRRILGFAVSNMPTKSLHANLAKKKYGPRPDERKQGRDSLFEKLKPVLHPDAVIESDKHKQYPSSVKKHFPNATHIAYASRRSREHGHGELKKGGFDPLFSLNHTCAMLRGNINRLVRKTWATTKKKSALSNHIEIYVNYHNRVLIPQ
jgi:hypothetical protein